MAFDYGSIDLGLKNPFKKEGLIHAIRGLIVSGAGIYLLVVAAANVKSNGVVGWIFVLFGLALLASGIRATSYGLIAMLRYFVGRNHPTSLATNQSRSESSTAKEEAAYVAYSRQGLIEMLVGRKNATFVEPDGLLARLVHSLFPRLTFMPYPIRNLAQRLFGAWVKTIVAIIAYGFVAFVSLAGFAGQIGEYLFPAYSFVLALYLLNVWRNTGKGLQRNAEKSIRSLGSGELVKTIASAILLPVVIGVVLQLMLSYTGMSIKQLDRILAYLPNFHATYYLIGVAVGGVVTSTVLTLMLRKRIACADPKVEVSELRENWQESVHPNEIFINLDNLVMANRRYKEVPNRVYQELEPRLEEQVEGKGTFFGEMIQEIQPKFKAMDLGKGFNLTRLMSVISGNILFVISAMFTLWLAYAAVDTYSFINQVGFDRFFHRAPAARIAAFSDYAGVVIHLALVIAFIRAFAHIFANAGHLFFAEMQFESHLIYVKVEGTFTESKISTGTGIHDSTRSENTLVRSSITPWVIVSRLVTSTFAATGMRNLEHPRLILEMHKSDDELRGIRDDVISFLKDRESIAAITSERDLANTSQIYNINEQSRSTSLHHKPTDEAAGYISKQDELKTDQ